MLIQILQGTPVWVWGLLALLVTLGVWQSMPRRVSARRVLIVPGVMLALSLAGVASTFGARPLALAAWAAGIALAVVLGLDAVAPRGARWTPQAARFELPGSWLPLGLILGLFCIKYGVGVSLAITPALASNTPFEVGCRLRLRRLQRPVRGAGDRPAAAGRANLTLSARESLPMYNAANLPKAAQANSNRFWRRALRIATLLVVISLAIAFLFSQRFWIGFVYSMSIGTGCWFFIQSGLVLAARWLQRAVPVDERSDWPGWGAMVVVLPVGTVLGYTLGNAVANLVLGFDSAGPLTSNPRQALAMLAFALVPGIGVTYFFRSRARIAETEARALTAQREAAENKLRLLESQLEPHMLFNTLANLRVLIAADPPRAQAMLDQLIAFLRATLAASRTGTHSLAAEFARLGRLPGTDAGAHGRALALRLRPAAATRRRRGATAAAAAAGRKQHQARARAERHRRAHHGQRSTRRRATRVARSRYRPRPG